MAGIYESEKLTGPYIVWVDYGSEGWSGQNAKDFDDAVRISREFSYGQPVLITELVPTKVIDLRKPEVLNNLR